MPRSRCRSRPRFFRSAMSAASATMPEGVDAARRSLRPGGRRAPRLSFAPRSREQPGFASRRDHVRHDGRRHRAGRAQPRRIAGRRLADARRKAGSRRTLRIVSSLPVGVLCRHRADARALAAIRRHVATASALRRDRLVRAIAAQACDVAILPGSLAGRLAEAEIFEPPHCAERSFWPSGARPSACRSARSWHAARRDADRCSDFRRDRACAPRTASTAGRRSIPSGKVRAPHGKPGAVIVADIARTPGRHDQLRRADGAASCRSRRRTTSFASYFRSGDDGTLDTGYPCRAEPQASALAVTGPPAGLVAVGGYRFAIRDVQNLVAQADQEANARRPAGCLCRAPARRHQQGSRGDAPYAFGDRPQPPGAYGPFATVQHGLSSVRWHDGFRSSR